MGDTVEQSVVCTKPRSSSICPLLFPDMRECPMVRRGDREVRAPHPASGQTARRVADGLPQAAAV
jgi:hypothetical protein